MAEFWCLIVGSIIFCLGGLTTYWTHKKVKCRYPYFIGGGCLAVIICLVIRYLI